MGLLTILIFAFTAFLNGAQKGQKNVQNAVDFDILKSSINLVLRSQSCGSALKDSSGNPITFQFASNILSNTPASNLPLDISKINLGGTVLAEKGASLGGGMSIGQIQVVEALYNGDRQVENTPSTTPPTYTTYKSFASIIKVTANKAAGSFGGQTLSAQFGVELWANATGAMIGQVQKCATNEPLSTTPPANFTWVGDPSNIYSYLISTAVRPPQLTKDATADCLSYGPGYQICSLDQWVRACKEVPSIFSDSVSERNIQPALCLSKGTDGSCTNWTSNCNSATEPMPYRCCRGQ